MRKILLAAPSLALSTVALACGGVPEPIDDSRSAEAEAARAPSDANGETSVARRDDGAVVMSNGDHSVVLKPGASSVSFEFLARGKWVGRQTLSESGEFMIQTDKLTKKVTVDSTVVAGLAKRDAVAMASFEAALGYSPEERAEFASLAIYQKLLNAGASKLAQGIRTETEATQEVGYCWQAWACMAAVAAGGIALAISTAGAGAGAMAILMADIGGAAGYGLVTLDAICTWAFCS